MAIQSLNVLLDPTGKMLLAEISKGMVENYQGNAISTQLKNVELSGNPDAGTVKARRFQNATSQAYGTARAAGKGQSIKGKDVTIDIDQDREFVEELEEKDVNLLGVIQTVTQRAQNHRTQLVAELDTAFFLEGQTSGTAYTAPSGVTAVADILEDAALTLESMKTPYVDGIPRTLMNFVLSPAYYSQVRTYLDTVSNTGITTQNEEFVEFHGVRVYKSLNLPTGVNFELMVKGAIAQPVMMNQYQAERVPMSDAMAVEMFYYYGTKAVTPELILVG